MDEDKIKQEYDKFIADRKEQGVEFKSLHSEKDNWFYEVPWTLKGDPEVGYEDENGVHTFIKVGPYGTDDIQITPTPSGSIIVNYAEPFQEFDSIEDAYICHNWLWLYFEENRDKLSACCDAKFIEDTDVCSECKEHC